MLGVGACRSLAYLAVADRRPVGIITYDKAVLVTCHVDKVAGFEDVASRICRDFEKRFKLYHAKAQEALGEQYAEIVKQ